MRSLWEDNVFSSVCPSVHMDMVPLYIRIDTPPPAMSGLEDTTTESLLMSGPQSQFLVR